MIFEGSAVALATPFTEDGINFETLEQLLWLHINSGTDAIVISGTTGEPSTMSDQERDDLVDFTMKTAGERLPVIVGVGGNNTRAAAEAAARAAEKGASGVLAVTPYYNKCSETGLVAHFTAIADAAGIPVIVYNVPSRTGVNLTPDILARIAHHPMIQAVKEASGDISQVAEMIRVAGHHVDFYSGNDDHIVPVLSLGAKGVISVAANIMPSYMHEMVTAFRSGDTEKARLMQLGINGLVRELFSEVNPIPVKSALRLMGYDMGDVRLPLTRLSPEKERRLHEQMTLMGLLQEEVL